jgi:DNase/tRNase domain of colicin-like bacteriocin
MAIAVRAREKGLVIVNGGLAGKRHPVTGVPFRESGFPDFSQYADDAAKALGKPTTVQVEGITGNRARDFALANKAAGFERTPKGYTWHHVEDCRHMQLVPTSVHRPTSHSGCVQLIQNGVVKP